MPNFPATLSLGALDGSNGFRLDGVAASDGSGQPVSSAGDVNGDGFDDLIVGASGADPGGNNGAGSSYVVFGSAAPYDASLSLGSLDGTNGFRLDGVARNDGSGFSVSSAGDVNGDGIDDFIVGAVGADPGGNSRAGSSYVVFGSTGPFDASLSLGSLDGTNGFRLDGVAANDYSGRSVSSAGDVNGDGVDDLIVGAGDADPGENSSAGSSYVVFGSATPFDASLSLGTLDGTNGFRLDGVAASDISGRSVSSAGDVNGDGLDDLIIGASGADPGGNGFAGSSYVVFGSAAPFDASFSLGLLDGTNGFRLDGVAASDQSGYSVSSAGDVNGDGIDDLIVGAFRADSDGSSGTNGNLGEGSSYVVFGSAGSFDASLSLGSLDGSNGFRLDGVTGGDLSGLSVSSAGDVNGDGVDDLIIGAYDADPGGNSRAGSSYVVFGSTGPFDASLSLGSLDGTNGFRLDGVAGSDFSGRSVSSAGDVNGDGVDDLIIGAAGADPGENSLAGSSYVVFGLLANNAPAAADDMLATDEDTLLTGDLFADNGMGVDADIEGDVFSIVAIDGVAASDGADIVLANGGLLRVNADGTFSYDPRSFLDGLTQSEIVSDSFDYTIEDAFGGQSTATVEIDTMGVNDAPIAAGRIFNINENQTLSDQLLAIHLDNETLDPLTFTLASGGDPANGDVAINSDGTFTYAPDMDFDGQDSFVFDVSDAFTSSQATITINLAPVSMPNFPATFSLGDLDGTNGFRLDGATAGEGSGRSVSSAGDVNGDGFDDLIVGANAADPGGNVNAGSSYVVFGSSAPFDASLSLGSLDGSNGFRLDGVAGSDGSGISVSSAGDVNGDSIGDLIVGAFGADPGGNVDAGSSYVVFGSAGPFVGILSLGSLDGSNGFRLDGVAANDLSGGSVSSAGDVNGDGIDDLIVGARLADPDGISGAGSSYVVFGSAAPFVASLSLGSLDGLNGFRLDGVTVEDRSGGSVSSAGDVNGDGIDDLIVGAERADPGGNGEAGSSYVVFGSATPFDASFSLGALDGLNGFRLDGVTAVDFSGRSVSSAGDVNGDGIDDLIVGANAADLGNSGAGSSYVVFGSSAPFDASLSLGALDGSNGFRLDGVAIGDASGFSVSAAGDLNGDGLNDLIVGAFSASPGGNNNEGSSYVVFGSAGPFDASLSLGALDGSNGFRLDGVAELDFSGFSVSSAGDVNGDGVDDLIVGAYRADPDGSVGAGSSYVVFGVSAENSPPIAAGDQFNIDQGAALSFEDLFADNGFGPDIDTEGSFSVVAVNGDPQSVNTNLTLASGAEVFIDSDGSLSYDQRGAFDALAEGATMDEVVTYTIEDEEGLQSTAAITISITGLNDAPIAADDMLATDEDTLLTGDLFADNGRGVDADIDGDGFTVVEVGDAATLVRPDITVTNGGEFRFDGVVGIDSTFSAAAAAVGTDIVLANGGLLRVNADGTFSYDPRGVLDSLTQGEIVSDSFDYTIEDAFGSRATATVEIDTTGVNDAPVAIDDAAILPEDGTVSFNLLDGTAPSPDLTPDTDFEDAALTVVAIDGGLVESDGPLTVTTIAGLQVILSPSGGVEVSDPSGIFAFLDTGEQAISTFTYSVQDSGGLQDDATVTVTVDGANDAPVAANDAIQLISDRTAFIELVAGQAGGGADVDPEGQALRIIALNGLSVVTGDIINLPSGARVRLTDDGIAEYLPNGAFDILQPLEVARDTFTYTIEDTGGLSSTASVIVTIDAATLPPTIDATTLPPDAIDDLVATNEDTAITVDLFADNGAGSDVDSVNLGLTIAAINGTLATAGDVLDLAAGGTLTVVAGGSVTFDPSGIFDFLDTGEQAISSFTYTVQDSGGLQDDATVTVTVDGANDAPVAANDAIQLISDQTLVVDLVAGQAGAGADFDAESQALRITALNGFSVVTGDIINLPSGARVRLTDDGTAEYLPNGAFDILQPLEVAQDTFTYTIEDTGGLSSTASVIVTIDAATLPPTIDATALPPDAIDDLVATNEDTAITVDLFADNGAGSDADSVNLGLTIAAINGTLATAVDVLDLAAGGTLTVVAGGSVTFDPSGDFEALDEGDITDVSFTYTVSDGLGQTDTATATFSVTGVNDAPIARPDAFATDEETAISRDLFADNGAENDTDADDALSLTAVNGRAITGTATLTLASGALLIVGVDGAITYDPNDVFEDLNAGEAATDSFIYTLTDDNGLTSDATATITVDGITDIIFGTDGDDFLLGTEEADNIDGLRGNDLISGLNGDDTLTGSGDDDVARGGGDNDLITGNNGDDRLFGEAGNDTLDGGNGNDRLFGGRGNDRVIGGAGEDVLAGSRGNDFLLGEGGADTLRGGGGNDTLVGGGANDRLRGGSGDDIIRGGTGVDQLSGAVGDDTLIGGGGADRLNGGRGNDVLSGGGGQDRFLFTSGGGDDAINAFQQDVDLIRILNGAGSFADLSLAQVGVDVEIAFADVTITVREDDVSAFSASDFIF